MEHQVTEVEQRSLLLSRRPRSSDIVQYTIYNYTDIQCIAYALKPFFGMVAYSEVGWTEKDTCKTHSTL